MPDEQIRQTPGESISFEQALSRLEQVVQRLEDGELGLADALAEYEQGVRMLRQCYGLLEKAERRIELLTGVDAEGNPVVQALGDAGNEPDAAPEAAKPGQGASQRTAGSRQRTTGSRRKRGEPPGATPKGTPAEPEPETDVDTPDSLF